MKLYATSLSNCPEDDEKPPAETEKEKRLRWIDEQVKEFVKLAEDEELEEEMVRSPVDRCAARQSRDRIDKV